ncbi:MAG: cysteine--tRNA ligase [candidate division Zixibacteria bacterium]|nr:cysteine--tRNA ligase [candidate division Zixibacteria bacterium]
MGLRLFNTLTRQKEDFVSIEPGKVRMYTCGPTVYDFAHIGNFRAYIVADLVKRYLRYKGYEVKQVVNLTDVDDRTIKGSQEKQFPLNEYTKKYKEAYFQDVKSMNIEMADIYSEATAHIKEMVELVKKLLEKGRAYQLAGSIYYKISSFKDYGKLSKMKREDLKAGVRISKDTYEKEEVGDFALWKGWDEEDGEVFWETEIGKGRPGWHIECSAMSMKYLGKHFDIHTGGVDLIFPHHENEIAQSEGVTGEKFVSFWIHNEHLLVEGRKMSKSLGNFYTLRDILEKGYSPMSIRYLLLATHYRQQLNFTFEGLDGAKNALQRLYDFMDRLKSIKSQKSHPEVAEILNEAQSGFEESFDDDLNTSSALGKIFDLVKEINRFIDEGDFSSQDAEKTLALMQRFDSVLGILKREELKLDEKITELIRKRNQARREKKWEEADRVRKEIESLGIILEDTPEGTKWKKRI